MSEEILTTQENEQAVVTPAAEEVKEAPKKENFFKGPIFKCVIVLTLIATIAGALLGLVNYFTYVDADAVNLEKVAAYYSVSADAVSKSDKSFDNINALYIAKDGDNIKGYCFHAVGTGAKDGTMELLVYIGADGKISEIAVYSQGETAGYFDKVEKANKSKYIGTDLDDVNIAFDKKGKLVSTDDTKYIAAVSSATYTSTGYHNAIAAAAAAYKSL